MGHPQELVDLDKRATEHELVAQHALNYETWLKNELSAAELRRRIEVLKQRRAKRSDDLS
jgi:hypothetical protein